MSDEGFRYDIKKIFDCVHLKTIYEESILQIVVENGHWAVLETLIETLNYVSPINTRDLLMALDVSHENEPNVLTKLYREEQAFRIRMVTEMVVPSFLEKKASEERLKLAKKLVSFGLRSSGSTTTIESWRFESPSRREGILNFFSIFCPTSSLRVKRSDTCAFSVEEDPFQASFPENSVQVRKEALVNMIAFFTRSNADSIDQVNLIRKRFLLVKESRRN